jgi:CRISPR type III-A-associated RAMP protein Csm4
LPISENNLIWFPRPPLEGSILDKDNRGELIRAYPIHKQFKKINYLDWETFKKILKGEVKTESDLFKEIKERSKEWNPKVGDEKELLALYRKKIPSIKTEVNVKTAIDRLTNTAKEGELFNEIVNVFPKFAVLVKVFNEELWNKAKNALRVVKLGGNKTVGQGRFTFEEVENTALLKELKDFIEEPTNKAITLAPTFYDENINLEESLYEPRIWRSAVDKTYAYWDPDYITLPVWKKATVYLKSGSLLVLKESSKVIGALKEALIWERDNKTYTVYNYGYGFPLFVKSEGGTK